MPEKAPENPSYLKEVARFYFAPDLRSIGTLLYLGVFGYCAIYYVNNIFLALRFVLYIILGHTVLSGTSFLFTGMVFVIGLVLPFLISFYAIFILHRVWDKKTWATYAKWAVTILIAIVSILVIIASDDLAIYAAHQQTMASFMEDANLTGRI
ncbi:MAG: hypothetical protein KGI79_02400 [Patescibacteria group bacterium]|nr:hypothetical protein [Patescibacteria group bacterium]MDE2116703.1 hypothetical protein [Patescibacteria group bacterium]